MGVRQKSKRLCDQRLFVPSRCPLSVAAAFLERQRPSAIFGAAPAARSRVTARAATAPLGVSNQQWSGIATRARDGVPNRHWREGGSSPRDLRGLVDLGSRIAERARRPGHRARFLVRASHDSSCFPRYRPHSPRPPFRARRSPFTVRVVAAGWVAAPPLVLDVCACVAPLIRHARAFPRHALEQSRRALRRPRNSGSDAGHPAGPSPFRPYLYGRLLRECQTLWGAPSCPDARIARVGARELGGHARAANVRSRYQPAKGLAGRKRHDYQGLEATGQSSRAGFSPPRRLRRGPRRGSPRAGTRRPG